MGTCGVFQWLERRLCLYIRFLYNILSERGTRSHVTAPMNGLFEAAQGASTGELSFLMTFVAVHVEPLFHAFGASDFFSHAASPRSNTSYSVNLSAINSHQGELYSSSLFLSLFLPFQLLCLVVTSVVLSKVQGGVTGWHSVVRLVHCVFVCVYFFSLGNSSLIVDQLAPSLPRYLTRCKAPNCPVTVARNTKPALLTAATSSTMNESLVVSRVAERNAQTMDCSVAEATEEQTRRKSDRHEYQWWVRSVRECVILLMLVLDLMRVTYAFFAVDPLRRKAGHQMCPDCEVQWSLPPRGSSLFGGVGLESTTESEALRFPRERHSHVCDFRSRNNAQALSTGHNSERNGRHLEEGGNDNRRESASWFARVTYTWMNHIVLRGQHDPWTLSPAKLPPLLERVRAEHARREADNIFAEMVQEHQRVKSQCSVREPSDWRVMRGILRAVSRLYWWVYVSSKSESSTQRLSDENDAESREMPHMAGWTKWMLHMLLQTRGGKMFVFTCIPIKLVQNLLSLTMPYVLYQLVSFAKHQATDLTVGWKGVGICVAFFALQSIQALVFQSYLTYLYECSAHAATVLRFLLMKKIMTLPLWARSGTSSAMETTEGAVLAAATVEMTIIAEAIIFLHNVWGHPMVIVIAVLILHSYVGWIAAGATFLSVVMVVPLNRCFMRYLNGQQAAVASAASRRIAVITEMLNAIHQVKSSAWDDIALESILAHRKKEEDSRAKVLRIETLSLFVTELFTALMTVVCFSVYYAVGGEMTPERLIPALAVIGVLKFPLFSMAGLLSNVSRASVAFRRLALLLTLHLGEGAERNSAIPSFTLYPPTEEYTRSEEMRHVDSPLAPLDDEVVVSCGGGDFGWGSSTVLRNVSMNFLRGERVVILGNVASGKSTLLLAIAGEVRCLRGTPFVMRKGMGCADGSVVFCSSSPWLRRQSIRDNILMGRTFQPKRYFACVARCALEVDFANMLAGDQTMVTDGGASLSGGQRARVALARALYGDAMLYLFDGIFEALDGAVRAHVIREAILGQLSHSAVVVACNSDPTALEPHRLLQVTDGHVSELPPGERCVASLSFVSLPNLEGDAKGAALSLAEPAGGETALLSPPSTSRWTAAGICLFIVGPLSVATVVLSATTHLLNISADMWMGYWVGGRVAATASVFLAVYASMALGAAAVTLGRAALFYAGCFKVGRVLSNAAYRRVLEAPLSWTERTPRAVLLSVFSRDQDRVDRAIPASLQLLLFTLMRILFVSLLNMAVAPLTLVVLPLCAGLYFRVTRCYLAVANVICHWSSATATDVTETFRDAMKGSVTLRSNAEFHEGILQELEVKVNAFNQVGVAGDALARWVGLRLEFVSVILTTFAALVATIFRSVISPALAGVAIVNVLHTSRALLMLCRRAGMLQSEFLSAAHLCALALYPPKENADEGWTKETEGEIALEYWTSQRERRVAEAWSNLWSIFKRSYSRKQWCGVSAVPSSTQLLPGEENFYEAAKTLPRAEDTDPFGSGSVEWLDVTVRYTVSSPVVLRRVSLFIPHATKVGLIGRTGSGKTTFFNTMLRLTDCVDGVVRIGGVDIRRVPRRALRRAVMYVPQRCAVLCGSWRMNLDPWNKEEDASLLDALRAVGLSAQLFSPSVSSVRLDEDVPATLSTGETQLLSLARCLLRRHHVHLLLLDEVTAPLDESTDDRIRNAVDAVSKEKTVILSAHRERSLRACDVIFAVGAAGEVSKVS